MTLPAVGLRVISALGIGPHVDHLEADWEGHETEVRNMLDCMRDLSEIEGKDVVKWMKRSTIWPSPRLFLKCLARVAI